MFDYDAWITTPPEEKEEPEARVCEYKYTLNCIYDDGTNCEDWADEEELYKFYKEELEWLVNNDGLVKFEVYPVIEQFYAYYGKYEEDYYEEIVGYYTDEEPCYVYTVA